VRPLLIWRCTHYVFTDERVLLQDGVIARERRDLPLARVSDHGMSQSLLERMFGCGTLTIDSIGDQAAVLESVPHVPHVQTLLYELIDADRERPTDADGDYAEAEEDNEDEVSDARPAARPAPMQARRRGRAPR
jgi:uncharacterized membrane protein YdbT with pleckstrin-like domain